MGYTHYWHWNPVIAEKGETFTKWAADVWTLLEALPKEVEGQPLVIRGLNGTGDPIITQTEVIFNGDASRELDHEPFIITLESLFASERNRSHRIDSYNQLLEELNYTPNLQEELDLDSPVDVQAELREVVESITSRGLTQFAFCKTARKPYDLLVTAALIRFGHHFGKDVEVSSDGEEEDWQPAAELCQKVFGVGIIPF